MRKLCKKGALLFAASMVVCATGMSSVASAASWSPVGLETTLDSPSIGFTSGAGVGTLISECQRSSLTANVVSAGDLTITSGSFGNCSAILLPGSFPCTVTTVGTGFPWRATVPTTNNIQIHGVHLDLRFENTPGSTACAAIGLSGANQIITGTVSGGQWTGNSSREIIFSRAEGLVSHSITGNGLTVTTTSTFRSTQNLQVVG